MNANNIVLLQSKDLIRKKKRNVEKLRLQYHHFVIFS